MIDMVWKKNFVSVILWAVYFMGISAALMYYSYGAVIESGLQEPVTASLLAICFWGGAVLLFLLCRPVMKRLPTKLFSSDSEASGLIEGVLFIALITAGLFFRIVNMEYAGESASYYDVAKVTEDGGIPEVTHGATFFYVCLLRILFTVVGNKWIAGIWLQVVLQILAAILLYVAVRKLAGAVSGLILLAMMMLLSTEVMRGLTYSPHMFYLCIYAIGLLGVAIFLDRQAHGARGFGRDALLLLFVGAWVGIVCYLDVTGLTLLIPVLFALHVEKTKDTRLETAWSVLVVFLLVVLCFIGYVFLDAYLCRKDMMNILEAWLEVFRVKAKDMWFWYVSEELIAGNIVLGVMVFGVLGFWVSGKQQRFTLWIVMLLLLSVMAYFHIPADNMDAGMISLIVGSIVGGVGIRECICGGKVVREEVQVVQESQYVDAAYDEKAPQDMGNWTLVETPKPVKYIENPLPLPKKHVKKVLDYSVEPQEEWMHYDIDVQEDDDFDL